MMIYNIIFALVCTILFSVNSSFASEFGHVEKSSVLFDYSKLNESLIEKEADTCFNSFMNSAEKSENLLNMCAGKYYLLTKINNANIKPYVRLGRIYDEKNKTRLAKENFYRAVNINYTDPYANFYFGEFYYKRNDYKRALEYYNKAYNYGLSGKYELNYKLGIIYEKFADLINAKKYYEISNKIKPDSELQKKIQSLNDLEYFKSEYYHTIRE